MVSTTNNSKPEPGHAGSGSGNVDVISGFRCSILFLDPKVDVFSVSTNWTNLKIYEIGLSALGLDGELEVCDL